jgi:hypothetical protein|tara:strand:+ start:4690 stop:5709 length:1020 start_codon:yes stop_codon:yes gene_type:complete
MQKINRRNVETFSLSFLDIIACGFGAIVLLLLIAKVGNPTSTVEISKDDLLNQLFDLQDQKKDLDIELLSLRNNQISINNIYDSERQNQNTQKQRLEVIKQNQTITESLKERLYLAQQSLTEEMKRILDGQVRDVEVGGIPVDSEYIIFVIDNSGSMYSVWDELLEEMDNILDIHPTIEGIQVLNDQGKYLMNSFQGKNSWIPDTPVYRKAIRERLSNMNNLGLSLSNPVQGIKKAINAHYNQGKKVSIYVLGDDIRSQSLERDINEIQRLNTNQFDGTKKARIHGIAFPSDYQSEVVRFSHFMRQVCKKNEGTFLGLSIRGHSGYVDVPPGTVIPTDD